MISCPGLLADTEMAQRSNRRFLNLISVEVFQAVTLIRKRAGGIHHGQESLTPPKAEYIGADQTVISIFRLQFCGGPYIPIIVLIGWSQSPLIHKRELEPAATAAKRARGPRGPRTHLIAASEELPILCRRV
jgi:hypothetical protein